MFAEVQFPQILSPEELDNYLAAGWFRMGQTIFTTNFLNFKNQFYSAIWLRVDLNEFKPSKPQLKLIKQNGNFKVVFKKASLTEEKEKLFAKYKESVTFEASASLNHLLYGKGNTNVYDTCEVNILDGNKIIAIGYFDIGRKAAAGISSFYDPDYKKFSLGKYLIYLKMNYCQKAGFKFFYPGYFVPGYAAFDYKLELSSALQYLQFSTRQWLLIDNFSAVNIPFQFIREKLMQLQSVLSKSGVANKLYRYEFFDANLIPDLSGLALFDSPLFLICYSAIENEINPMVIYNITTNQYELVKCRSVWPSKLENDQEDVYCKHLLKIEQYLFSTADANDIASVLIGESIQD